MLRSSEVEELNRIDEKGVRFMGKIFKIAEEVMEWILRALSVTWLVCTVIALFIAAVYVLPYTSEKGDEFMQLATSFHHTNSMVEYSLVLNGFTMFVSPLILACAYALFACRLVSFIIKHDTQLLSGWAPYAVGTALIGMIYASLILAQEKSIPNDLHRYVCVSVIVSFIFFLAVLVASEKKKTERGV